MKWVVRFILSVVLALSAYLFCLTFDVAPLYLREKVPRSVVVKRWIYLIVGSCCLGELFFSFGSPRKRNNV